MKYHELERGFDPLVTVGGWTFWLTDILLVRRDTENGEAFDKVTLRSEQYFVLRGEAALAFRAYVEGFSVNLDKPEPQ